VLLEVVYRLEKFLQVFLAMAADEICWTAFCPCPGQTGCNRDSKSLGTKYNKDEARALITHHLNKSSYHNMKLADAKAWAAKAKLTKWIGDHEATDEEAAQQVPTRLDLIEAGLGRGAYGRVAPPPALREKDTRRRSRTRSPIHRQRPFSKPGPAASTAAAATTAAKKMSRAPVVAKKVAIANEAEPSSTAAPSRPLGFQPDSEGPLDFVPNENRRDERVIRKTVKEQITEAVSAGMQLAALHIEGTAADPLPGSATRRRKSEEHWAASIACLVKMEAAARNMAQIAERAAVAFTAEAEVMHQQVIALQALGVIHEEPLLIEEIS